MKNKSIIIAFLLTLLFCFTSQAITVNPTGVNINRTGATSVFLTFRDIDPDQQPVEAIWCGAINPDNSCVPGTIFGSLPLRSNLATPSRGGNNLTDIMTIPPSIARKAFQDAQRGNASQFFYVRRFVNIQTGASEFVAVTCRMAGGGARSPLALIDVRLHFKTDKPVLAVGQDETPPQFGADIQYTGAGRLTGRWEVVLPGDVQPSVRDLLTEATLPIEERVQQRQYTLIDRFDVFLPPTGKFYLPGPNPEKLPRGSSGLHVILLRIEATDDKDSQSNIGTGVVVAGGVAGFPMPVLRYYVGSESEAGKLTDQTENGIRLISPSMGTTLSKTDSLNFYWTSQAKSMVLKLDIESDDGPVFSALIDPGVSSYSAPPWLRDFSGKTLRWKIQSLGLEGDTIAETSWNTFEISQ